MPKMTWHVPGETIPKVKAFTGDCDDVRRKVASFLGSKQLSKAAFLRQCGEAIGKAQIDPGSYAKFMSLKGPNAGEDMGFYAAAQAFFGSGSAAVSAAAALKPTKAEAAARFATLCAEVDAVELPDDDEDDEVGIDTMSCNLVRRRLNEFVGAEGITQSAMMSYLGVKAPSWANFMSYTGADQGSGSSVYYKARRFFTQLRVLKAQGKGKAKAKGTAAAAAVEPILPAALAGVKRARE